MQIVIPMSGFGERFRRAGYDLPKPLIEIEGRPIIGHVLDMFPGEHDIIFVCNRDHLADPDFAMAEILRDLCPSGKIVPIEPHKLGPIHAVQQARDHIALEKPIVVNYCDFNCLWDWNDFKQFIEDSNCAGAIPAYKGFHPHSLGVTNYAYMRETNGWVSEIQEKQPFTDDRMQEFASSGTYYFASGRLMLEAFDITVEKNRSIGGEFYVSLAYQVLLERQFPVAVYPLKYFMQWGTPEDVAEFRDWSSAFRGLVEQPVLRRSPIGSVIVPMAGLGKRFSDEGYVVPKPLIDVSGSPMVLQAARDLPPALKYSFVLRTDMPGKDGVEAVLEANFPHAILTEIHEATDGQAISTLIGLDALAGELGGVADPITIGTCDNGILHDRNALDSLLVEGEADVLVWAVRGYANSARFPEMYGWLDVEDGHVRGVSVKKPLKDPASDPVVIGTFTFRHHEQLRQCIDRMVKRNGRINGEFYLDECINDALDLGLTVKIHEINNYLAWGTPNDLRSFEYWQGAFDLWEGHPYSLELDSRVEKAVVHELRAGYALDVPRSLKPGSSSTSIWQG